jgi:predicted Rossmann fold nucleotide-binding protein DprA/Smf involved in DNA uptake
VDSKASEGCHRIIRQGWATLVTGGADVLDALGETGQILKAEMTQTEPASSEPTQDTPQDTVNETGGAQDQQSGGLFSATLSDTQQKIVEALDEPRTLDQLVAVTDLDASQIQSQLTMMEIHGTIERKGGLLQRRRQ